MLAFFFFFFLTCGVVAGQSIQINETFSGNSLPSGWAQSGGVIVQNGILTLTNGCVTLPGTYARGQGLSIEANVTIQNGGIGDFNIWGLYDNLKNNDCHSGPQNGYYTAWYPIGSDNPNDVIIRDMAARG